jgi:hypothetical protein
MKCPNCGLIDKNCRVTDTRREHNTIRRSRLCSECGWKWRTYEVHEDRFLTGRNKHVGFPWSEKEVQNVVRLYDQGKTRKEISELLGRKPKSASRKLDEILANGEYVEILNLIREESEENKHECKVNGPYSVKRGIL